MKHDSQSRTTIPSIDMDTGLRFKVTESYKAVRTNIMFSLLKKGCKKLVISSSLAGEGKTTTAVNISISLAQMNLKVLLIDADLRKPKVNQFFELKNTPGLTNFLGHMSERDEIIHRTEYKNLSVICSGVIVPNPSELLSSEEIASFFKETETQFDYIVIDTSPINEVIDALPLIKLSDGVILVIREGASTYPELNKTIKSLEFVDAKILGLILNGTKAEGKSYRYRREKYGTYGL
jgi:capsular exopolysaccharide synthesis family protein